MKIIKRKSVNPKRIYSDARKWIWMKEAMAFKKWLAKTKRYDVHHNPAAPLVFWYRETPSSPKITVEIHPDSRKKCLIHVLGNDHLAQFFSGPVKLKEPRKDRMMKDFYRSYMKSDGWRDKSLRCFADADSECEVCGCGDDLNSHHYNYHNLGSETANDLFCLCKACHTAYHKRFPSDRLPSDRDVPRVNRLRHIQITVLSMRKKAKGEVCPSLVSTKPELK